MFNLKVKRLWGNRSVDKSNDDYSTIERKGFVMAINNDAVVYISENCKECNDLLRQLKEWNVSYDIINVTKEENKMKDLQSMNIYGTPAIFISGYRQPILGFQKNKLEKIFSHRK